MTGEFFTIEERLAQIARVAEDKCQPFFQRTDEIARYNTEKVMAAFARQRVSEAHFVGSTGYGYGDRGREVLDAVFAQIVGAEDALVRHNFVSGTHALSVTLFGVLRMGDTLLSATGRPYDTMEEVIGLRGEGNGSLKDFGIHYKQVDLDEKGKVNLRGIEAACKDVKMVYIQRSRGYSLRPSISVSEIAKIAKTVHQANPDAVVMVDNCYGEFVEEKEPTDVGADLIVGSLIKNPGGGIAKTGGYIAGRQDLVAQCAYRLTCIGMGKEVGCTLAQSREMFMGLFFAPTVVASAVKTSLFATSLFQELGYEVFPSLKEPRTDIITAIKLGTPENLIAFCQGIQQGSPVDSFVMPEPWDMPGYASQVIMAAGTFTSGASIELSADAPLRPPYAVWLQGGLTYPSGRLGVLLAAQNMLKNL